MNNEEYKYILCAAIHVDDNIIHYQEEQPVNIRTGFVVCGRRHSNCYITISNIYGMISNNYCVNVDYSDIYIKHTIKEGFLTNDNRFLDRTEAGMLATRNGQINEVNNYLISEDLY